MCEARGHPGDPCPVTNVTARRYCMALGLLMLIKSYCSPQATTQRKRRSRRRRSEEEEEEGLHVRDRGVMDNLNRVRSRIIHINTLTNMKRLQPAH